MKAQRHARQWRLLAEISKTQRGLTIAQLMELTEQSRPNLYRDLQVLEEAGLPICRERGRVRLLTLKELPPAGFSALQIAALHLARLQLGPSRAPTLCASSTRFWQNCDPKTPKASFNSPAP